MYLQIEKGSLLKIKNLHHEINTCKRYLGFMMDENVHLKCRLSELLKYSSENALVERMEEFQNFFIKADELIGILRDEVASIEQTLLNASENDSVTVNLVADKIIELHNGMAASEKHFANTKSSFRTYLMQILW